MRKSQYVSSIKISERYTLLYNSLTNTFLILTPDLNSQWESFSTYDLKNKTLEDELKKGGFIIGSDVDETMILIDNLTNSINNDKDFHLIINPTLDCNLKCWYCYETHSHNKMNRQISNNIKMLITKTLNTPKIEHFHLSFFGGEPFLYFNLIVKELIHFTYTKCIETHKLFSMSFTTNGSVINDKILRELKQFEGSPINFQITVDGNKVFHDKVRHLKNGTGTYDTIIGNIRNILKQGFSVVMRINFTKDNIDSVKDILNDISEPIFVNNKNFHVDFQQVWQDASSYDIISKKIDNCVSQFRNLGIKVVYHYINRMNDPCYADKHNELVINYNGQVYKCTAQDFDKTPSYGILNDNGDIDWDDSMVKTRNECLMPPSNCLSCRIAPICGGGCSQHLINGRGKQYCVLNNDEKLKDKFILDRFENQFLG